MYWKSIPRAVFPCASSASFIRLSKEIGSKMILNQQVINKMWKIILDIHKQDERVVNNTVFVKGVNFFKMKR